MCWGIFVIELVGKGYRIIRLKQLSADLTMGENAYYKLTWMFVDIAVTFNKI